MDVGKADQTMVNSSTLIFSGKKKKEKMKERQTNLSKEKKMREDKARGKRPKRRVRVKRK